MPFLSHQLVFISRPGGWCARQVWPLRAPAKPVCWGLGAPGSPLPPSFVFSFHPDINLGYFLIFIHMDR